MNHGGKCWNCGESLSPLDYGRGDICKKCGRDTRTCKGCKHYDRDAHNQCHETIAERVVEKERSNFCDYFEPHDNSPSSQATSRDAMKLAAEALFKRKN